ncbi:MAG TPA: shikimate dehydrogenase [Anaerolineales bacterium]|nr:shikimate dehydrogenase [Anaerolineales bacterium]
MNKAEQKFWRLGLLGYPLGHSLSPRLHEAALEDTGLAGEYILYAISPDEPDELAGLLERVRSGDIDGLNVTIPYKESVTSYLDELTPAAAAIGAVNTIYTRQGSLVGTNTDAPGFLADLRRQTGWPMEAAHPEANRLPNALVLGAGGSARAVVYALGRAGWHVYVAARRLEQARLLTTSLREHILQPIHHLTFEALPVLFAAIAPVIELLVNTTPLGMTPDLMASPWPKKLDLPGSAFVYDLVYNPPETALFKAAHAAGLVAANGLGMLVEQAALSFECWTGRSASRAVMFQAAQS